MAAAEGGGRSGPPAVFRRGLPWWPRIGHAGGVTHSHTHPTAREPRSALTAPAPRPPFPLLRRIRTLNEVRAQHTHTSQRARRPPSDS